VKHYPSSVNDSLPHSTLVTNRSLERAKRHEITDLVFRVNLEYDTNFSTVVVEKASWENGKFTVLPIHDEIINEGIA
jgi:hypothetical protein